MIQTMQYFRGKSRREIIKLKLFYLEWRNLTNERIDTDPLPQMAQFSRR